MADHYLQFSEVLTKLTAEEEAWLKEQLQEICVFGDKEYAKDAIPAKLKCKKPNWEGYRFLRTTDDFEALCDDELGFCHQFDDDMDNDWGRHLWLYAEEGGDPNNVAQLVHLFLKKFRPDQYWVMEYACTCSKPRVGAFSGGNVFVTADEVKGQSTYDFLEQEIKVFEAAKEAAKEQ